MVSISARACSSVTPGLRRATPRSPGWLPRLFQLSSLESGPTGNQKSARLALAGEVVTAPVVNADVFEDRLLRAPVAEVRVGNRHGGKVRTAFAQPDQPPGVRIGQGAQQDRVDHAENRRVRPDAQRQCEQGHRGKARALGEYADGVAEVGHGNDASRARDEG